jgi:hypothetical protein
MYMKHIKKCYQNSHADAISKVVRDYHSRIERLEEEKYDLEYIVKGKDFQVHTDTLHYTYKRKQKISNDNKKIFNSSKNALSNLLYYFLNFFIYFHST